MPVLSKGGSLGCVGVGVVWRYGVVVYHELVTVPKIPGRACVCVCVCVRACVCETGRQEGGDLLHGNNPNIKNNDITHRGN